MDAPRIPIEDVIAAAWRDALGLDAVPADSDFFDSGGHSVSAIRLLDRVGGTCGVAVPLRVFLQDPTPAGLASAVKLAAAAARQGAAAAS